MPTSQDLFPELEAACNNLLWRSESDYSFEVAVFESVKQPAEILQRYPDNTPIKEISLDDFFGNAVLERSWFDSRELELVQRYRNLRDLLETTLGGLVVYRIGDVEIDVYLLGMTEDGQVMGVKTKIVET